LIASAVEFSPYPSYHISLIEYALTPPCAAALAARPPIAATNETFISATDERSNRNLVDNKFSAYEHRATPGFLSTQHGFKCGFLRRTKRMIYIFRAIELTCNINFISVKGAKQGSANVNACLEHVFRHELYYHS
jgi:hypothetical protein